MSRFDELMALVPKKLVLMREHPDYPELVLFKYTKRAFWSRAWDQYPVLQYARGHVYNKYTKELVVQPFDKVFNVGEPPSTVKLTDYVTDYVLKINGFLGVVTWLADRQEFLYTTTGSFDSPFVQMIKDILPEDELRKYASLYKENVSFMFEVCHPDDPHIVEEQVGAYLLGSCWSVENQTELFGVVDLDYDAIRYHNGGETKIKRIEAQRHNFREYKTLGSFIEDHKNERVEGYMINVWNQEEARYEIVKWKTPYYRNKKFLARTKNSDALSLIWDDPKAAERRFDDEELWVVFDALRLSISKDSFLAMDETARLQVLEAIM